MPTIELNPMTRIILDPYERVSKLLLYGGVEVNYSNEEDSFHKDLNGLLIDLSASYLQAYDIKSRFLNDKENIMGYLKPTKDEFIDPKCMDYNFKYCNKKEKSKLNELINKLKGWGGEHGVFFDNWKFPILKFNYIQSLKEKFNPVLTSYFIILIQRYATKFSTMYTHEVINGNIEDNLIFFYSKIKKDEKEYLG